MQQQYQLVRNPERSFTLKLTDAPVRRPGPNEVLVKVHSASLNRRDIMIVQQKGTTSQRDNFVPLSDGAGEVVEIGSGTTRVHVGDRVAAIFHQNWLSGRRSPMPPAALGGDIDGMLSQYATLSEQGLVTLPSHLSFDEGATLSCAAVTAWNGLDVYHRVQRGDYVLLLGTGGVSIFGLQFAVAAGAKAIVISSSDTKLQRAKELGAVGTINYHTFPEWDKKVRALTGDIGAHHVLEIGGHDTLPHSLASLAMGGHVALIGGLSGFSGEIPVMALLGLTGSASGFNVGSRADFEAMNSFIEKYRLKPIVDHVFDFTEAQSAYDYMESDKHVGKVIIRIAGRDPGSPSI